MEWIINNWFIIVALIAVLAAVISAAVYLFKMPTDKQIEALKEWLKYAVTLAEKELGTQTGQLKLRMVYDMALSKFSWLGRLVTFEQFSLYVDEALVWLNSQLESNKAVLTLVKGE
jgi:hypothetical protein